MSNADICHRCYPLLKGAKATCREHTLEAVLKPFAEASKRYEKNGGDFAQAFHAVSIADIRRAAAVSLVDDECPYPSGEGPCTCGLAHSM